MYMKMNNRIPALLLLAGAMMVAACSSTKKAARASVTPAPAPTTARTTSSNTYFFSKPADGVHDPGNEDLAAIQLQYKDVTLAELKEGHALYTRGSCISCHHAKNIYELQEASIKDIIEDLAKKARMPDNEKDAVYKYVLAMKATQPK